MAKFQESDLEHITIIKCIAVNVDDVHAFHRIVVQDQDNFKYMWRDHTSACGCDVNILTDSIKSHILTLDKKVITHVPITTMTPRTDIGPGTNLV